MAFFDRILKREATPPQESAPNVAAKSATYGTQVMSVGTPNAALSVAAFHRAVELRAKTMSQLLVQYQKINKAGGNFVVDTYGDGARMNYLLQVRPNPLMTASIFMQQAEIAKILSGNAYIYVEREEDNVEALWLCSYGVYDPTTDTYTLTYRGRRGVVNLSNVDSADVLHLPNTFRDPDGYVGYPTLTYAARTLSIAATNDYQTLDNASKGGKMKIIVQEERKPTMALGKANRNEMEKMRQKLSKDIYEDDVILLDNVASITPISQNAQQMELLESRKFSVREIARLTGVPPVLLMDDSNSSYKSPEAATQEFLLRTIQPAIREWEDELNSKLLTASDYGKRRFHLCAQPLRRLDPQGQANIDKINLETGVKSVNELRSQYDLPTVEGGDIHYISTNLAEVGSDKLRGSATTPPPADPINEEGGEA